MASSDHAPCRDDQRDTEAEPAENVPQVIADQRDDEANGADNAQRERHREYLRQRPPPTSQTIAHDVTASGEAPTGFVRRAGLRRASHR